MTIEPFDLEGELIWLWLERKKLLGHWLGPHKKDHSRNSCAAPASRCSTEGLEEEERPMQCLENG